MEEAIINWGLPLPLHIALVIFSKLSIPNFPACRLVSKLWNRLVYAEAAPISPNLIQSTISFSTVDRSPDGPSRDYFNPKIHCFDLHTLNFVASCTIHGPGVQYIQLRNYCNGLLFIEKGNMDIDCEGVFNPMTHEFFQIPICELHYALCHGFGFSPRTKQYKLFRARSGCELKVLRFGRNNNQWTSVSVPSPVSLRSHGVYMDGVVYWAGGKEKEDIIVYALDVDTENFDDEVVAVLEVGPYCGVHLQPFNGTIYAIVFKSFHVQVWKMERKDSWVRDFIVHGKFNDTAIDLLNSSRDGKVFLRVINDLLWSNKSMRKIEMKTLFPYDRQFFGTCFIESLHFGSLPSILAGDD